MQLPWWLTQQGRRSNRSAAELHRVPGGCAVINHKLSGHGNRRYGPSSDGECVLSVIPVTVSANQTTIPAGGSVTLTYSGPNNGSTYTPLTLPANTHMPLTGAAC